MDAVPDKVHFFNSFFHRQLVTKGYNGVKRWTKKVDLFKKSLLLIPIHLEVHWSLITVTLSNRIISFYDSQGIHFKFCVENIRKYLLTEAREKNRPEFLQGWQTAVTKCIPQQKNDSDCGVFVLQYCKCLALEQPFQFSQEDMPRVRKRIYKELCECRLMDWISRDSGKSDQVGAGGLLLESPNTYLNFYRYFRSVVLGHYCYLKFIFCP